MGVVRVTDAHTNPWGARPLTTVTVDGVRYLAISADRADEIHGPFTACDCRPLCGLPPCTGCGEDHGGHDRGSGVHLCRDCDIEYSMASMQCSGCKRMRYREETLLGNIGAYLWGERCTCAPRPPSMREVSDRER